MMDARMAAAGMANRVAHVVHGVVSAVDPVNHAVKVVIQPDNVETGWIADGALTQVGDIRMMCPCAVGSHVVLQPLEGDAEHYVVSGVVFDTVMMPPSSPQTGRVAQPGELLVMAGCGVPPTAEGQEAGRSGTGGGWFHVTPGGMFFGSGDGRVSIGASGVVIQFGDVKLSLSGRGVSVSGGTLTVSGDVMGNGHSLSEHVHPVSGGETGSAIG